MFLAQSDTVYVPSLANVWFTILSEEVVPSPKSHFHTSGLPQDASLKRTEVPVVAVAVNAAMTRFGMGSLLTLMR